MTDRRMIDQQTAGNPGSAPVKGSAGTLLQLALETCQGAVGF